MCHVSRNFSVPTLTGMIIALDWISTETKNVDVPRIPEAPDVEGESVQRS